MNTETHIMQELTVQPEMPLADLMGLFLLDPDLGLRFERHVDGIRSEFELQWIDESQIAVRVGVDRNCESSASNICNGTLISLRRASQ